MKLKIGYHIVNGDMRFRVVSDDGTKVRKLTEGEEAAIVMFLESDEGREFVDQGATFPGECGEVLYEQVGEASVAVARCTQPYGVEHSHNDCTASEAVTKGLARAIHITPGEEQE